MVLRHARWIVLATVVAAGPVSAEPVTDADVVVAAREMRWARDLGKDGPDTDENSAALLAIARNASRLPGPRWEALRAFAKMAARRHDASAAEAIWNQRGKAGNPLDPVFDAFIDLGASSLPYLARVLGECGGRELATGRLDDPKATIEVEEAGFAASAIVAIIDSDPKANAPQLATNLIAAFDCGGASVRQLSARALGLLDRLDPPETEALRKRVQKDRRADVRSFAASILAAHRCDDKATIQVLERALADRADVVRLGSANALIQLKRPQHALPTLKRLTKSHDPEVAHLAESILQKDPAHR